MKKINALHPLNTILKNVSEGKTDFEVKKLVSKRTPKKTNESDGSTIGKDDYVEWAGKEGTYYVVGIEGDNATVKEIGDIKMAYNAPVSELKVKQKGRTDEAKDDSVAFFDVMFVLTHGVKDGKLDEASKDKILDGFKDNRMKTTELKTLMSANTPNADKLMSDIDRVAKTGSINESTEDANASIIGIIASKFNPSEVILSNIKSIVADRVAGNSSVADFIGAMAAALSVSKAEIIKMFASTNPEFIGEGLFDKKDKGDSMMTFLDNVEKQANSFIDKIKNDANSECEKDAKAKGYKDSAKENFKKMYYEKAMTTIKNVMKEKSPGPSGSIED